MNPLITILMPAYNCAPYIEKAINSILTQTYSNVELVVCDDGSVDDTWEKICSIKDERIRRHKSPLNKGYLETYNFLMTQVRGDYFSFQDADDWSEPTRLQEQLDIFHAYSDIHVCACNGTFYYDETVKRPCPPFEPGYIRLTENNFQFMLPSIMYKAEVLKWVKEFHPYFNRSTGGDQYFILEVLSRFKGYAINKYLYIARFNPTSNHRTFDSLRKLTAPDAYFLLKKQRVTTGSDWLSEGKESLLLEYEKSLLTNRKFMAEKYREYAVYRIDSDQFYPAIKLIGRSILQTPFWVPTYRTLFYAFRKLITIK